MICLYPDAKGLQGVEFSDYPACEMVVPSGDEWERVMNHLNESSPFVMSRTDAIQLGAAIALIWVTAGVIRVIRKRI